MERYMILGDGSTGHINKWVSELTKYYELYLVSFRSVREDTVDIIGRDHVFELNSDINISGGNYSILRKVFVVRGIIKKVRPKYINAHYITSYGTVAVLARMFLSVNCKTIASCWGSDILVTPLKNKLYYLLTQFILMHSDLVTSDSSYMAEVIKNIHSKANVSVFPFGLNKLPKADIKEKNYNCIFSNRAWEPNYNIEKVIVFFDELCKGNSQLNLYIANVGSEELKINNKILKSINRERIHVLGYLSREEQNKMYQKCGYYISIPDSDSTSVSLLEAMAYGCIPIVSALPANLEWIQDNRNGIIYDEKIKKLPFLDEAFSYNRNSIEKYAIWPKIVQEYSGILRKL